MKDHIHLSCAVTSFILALTSQVYLAGWLTNTIVPVTIDSKPSSWDSLVLLPGSPFINNILLIMVFVLQHSLMARKAFKTMIDTCFPEDFERVVYNVMTVVVVYLMFFLWEPLPDVIWNVTIPWLRYTIIAVRLGFVMVVLKSVATLDRLILYGIKQPLCRVQNKQLPKVSLVKSGMFGIVRHPTMAGLMGIFLVTPTMTTGQLLFAITMTMYIMIAVLCLEERDLVHYFGSKYEEYKKTTPAFIPSLWRSHKLASD
ncbi:methanethiol S-methyltransferase-like [Dysidea avara]|uniref:methanethiol S-methyltransferase-like n=1 Tax=Dysidea avara TaxID=196820 RepID=UPI0033213B60